ncbi:hypothetical protein JXA40_05580 [bacterium]|nr:hypothetical protein [candidate division CSSED10-310 bacterium]
MTNPGTLEIPGTIPEFRFESRADPVGPVELTVFPATLDPIDPGIKLVIGEYRFPGGILSRIFSVRSDGPVLFEGRDLTRIYWNGEAEESGAFETVHWLDPGADTGIMVLRLREVRPGGGTPFFDSVFLSSPRSISRGYARRTEDHYHRGYREAVDVFEEQADSGGRLFLAGVERPCLRIRMRNPSVPGRVTEIYIDGETGRPVIQRLLVDPGGSKSSDETDWKCSCCRLPYYPD